MAYSNLAYKTRGDQITYTIWNQAMPTNMAAMMPDVFTAAGQMFLGTGAAAGSVLAVGSADEVLVYDSSQTQGFAFQDAARMWKLAETTLSASAASIDFQSIDTATFPHLILEASLKTDYDADYDGVNLRFNNVSTSTYYWVRYQVVSATATAAESTADSSIRIGNAPSGTSEPGWFGAFRVFMNGAGNSSTIADVHSINTMLCGMTSGDGRIWGAYGLKTTAAAITRITLLPNAGSNFVSGSKAVLYGLF